MFESDFPSDTMPAYGSWTGKRLVNVFNRLARSYPQQGQTFLWRETAMRFYHMKVGKEMIFSQKSDLEEVKVSSNSA